MTDRAPPPPSEPSPAAQAAPRVARGLTRLLLKLLAITCLGLALLGVVLPGLPTTVFLLIAAWAAARSSPRMAAWLEQHPLFGPMIRNWQAGGRVSRRAKWSATVTMLLCAAIMWRFSPFWGAVLGSVTMAIVCTWLWFRPEP